MSRSIARTQLQSRLYCGKFIRAGPCESRSRSATSLRKLNQLNQYHNDYRESSSLIILLTGSAQLSDFSECI